MCGGIFVLIVTESLNRSYRRNLGTHKLLLLLRRSLGVSLQIFACSIYTLLMSVLKMANKLLGVIVAGGISDFSFLCLCLTIKKNNVHPQMNCNMQYAISKMMVLYYLKIALNKVYKFLYLQRLYSRCSLHFEYIQDVLCLILLYIYNKYAKNMNVIICICIFIEQFQDIVQFT